MHLLGWIVLMLLQTTQDQLQVFLTAVGGMVQYAREDEAIQLQTVNARHPVTRMPSYTSEQGRTTPLGGMSSSCLSFIFLPPPTPP